MRVLHLHLQTEVASPPPLAMLCAWQVVVTDSAGIRETADPVEAEGVRRARQTAQQADVVVLVQDAMVAGSTSRGGQGRAWEQLLPQSVDWQGRSTQLLWLYNKADLVPHHAQQQRASVPGSECCSSDSQLGGSRSSAVRQTTGSSLAAGSDGSDGSPPPEPLHVSCLTGEGLDGFLEALQAAVQRAVAGGGDPAATALVTRARHRQAIQDCVAALKAYDAAPMEVELAAEELRGAARALGCVTGAIDTESVLDSLFAEFCIGK